MLFVLILLNLIAIISTTGNWHQLDGIEYYIEYTAVSGVDKAKEDCKAMNAIPAVVKSQRIQKFLMKNIDTSIVKAWPSSFYIGLSRTGLTTLQWSDGTTTDTSVFTYWDCLDDVYDSSKLCVSMGWEGGLNGFKWKIVECSKTHRYICQRNIPTTTTKTSPKTRTTTSKTASITTTFKLPTEALTTEQKLTTKGLLTLKQISTTEYKAKPTTKNTVVTMENKAAPRGTNVVVYSMIGVGAIVVLIICGIIYIKYYRNNKPTTYNVDERNSGSEEGPVVVDNVLYGTSAEPIQDLNEKADKVDPVYSCADAFASYVVPNVEFDPKAAVYDCTPDNASTDNDQNETDHNSREDPIEDVYAQVVKKKKTLKK